MQKQTGLLKRSFRRNEKRGEVMLVGIKTGWKKFSHKHPTVAQFLVFFLVSNGITVLQMFLMPAFRGLFGMTSLVNTNFQIWHVGSNLDGTPFYIFNYGAGALSLGGGGGLAYFLAVEITMAIAQVINFFLQRNVTFKANNSAAKAAMWYVIAYIIITIGAAALQGLYKAPIYHLFMNDLNLGTGGETIADVITMLINSAISFWVFFPIFKIIFKNEGQ
jgi:putative flippase GtrA